MTEYIKHEAVTCKDCFHYKVCGSFGFVLDPLHGGVPCDKFVPTADVVEVRHGYWKETITHNGCTWDSDCVCSVCGKSGHPCNNYCEECGAKMDLD